MAKIKLKNWLNGSLIVMSSIKVTRALWLSLHHVPAFHSSLRNCVFTTTFQILILGFVPEAQCKQPVLARFTLP